MTLARINQVTAAAARPEQAPAPADYAGWSAPGLLRDLLCRVFPRRIAPVSSFGIESAVLHLLSRIDRAAPVVFLGNGLPRRPLEAQGYRPLGCAPCTRPTAPGADPRAGRWAGRGKSECGIHRPHAPAAAPFAPAPPIAALPIPALTETSRHA